MLPLLLPFTLYKHFISAIPVLFTRKIQMGVVGLSFFFLFFSWKWFLGLQTKVHEELKMGFWGLCRCGDTRKLSIFVKCKQPGEIHVGIHALFSIKISKQCHKFHGNSLPSRTSWWLFIWCFLHYLSHLPHKCSHWISGNYIKSLSFPP